MPYNYLERLEISLAAKQKDVRTCRRAEDSFVLLVEFLSVRILTR